MISGGHTRLVSGQVERGFIRLQGVTCGQWCHIRLVSGQLGGGVSDYKGSYQ